MTKAFLLGFWVAIAVFVIPRALFAAAEIEISNVQAEMLAADEYVVRLRIENRTESLREVILRAQIAFYDRSSPKGDVPVAILRKDITRILEAETNQDMEVSLINEGSSLKGAVRMEPTVRVRRQREWVY